MKYTVESLIKELQTHNPKSIVALADWSEDYSRPLFDIDISNWYCSEKECSDLGINDDESILLLG